MLGSPCRICNTRLGGDDPLETIDTWEKIVAGIAAVLLVLWLSPGIRNAVERSRTATERDWGAVLASLGLVVLFVVLLIALA